MATWPWEVLCLPVGVGGWAVLSTHNCSEGGEDPSCYQCTACQEKGQLMGEAGSRMGVLEIKIIMKERRQRTEDWRTKWGRESGASEEIEESGRANSGKPREKKAFQKKLSVVSAGSDGREKSNGVKAEERPVGLSINKSLTVSLAPTSKLLGPWESPDSGRQFRKLFLKFWLKVRATWNQEEGTRSMWGGCCLNRGKADTAPLSSERLLSGSVEGDWASSSKINTFYEQPQ